MGVKKQLMAPCKQFFNKDDYSQCIESSFSHILRLISFNCLIKTEITTLLL